MKPAFEIYADGERVTPIFLRRGVSISVVDEAGVQADSLTITVQDAERDVAIPRRGAILLVSLGYEGDVSEMGTFVVDEVEIAGPPDVLVIKGTGAPLLKAEAFKPMQSRKTRSWEPGTLGVMALTIAQESGLQPEISASAAAVVLPHIDQTDESDLNLLTRIARDHDLVFKPQQGRLILLLRSESVNSNGRALPVVTVRRDNVSTYSFKVANRNRFQTVVTRWHNRDTGQEVEEPAGVGEPVFRPANTYPNQQAARAASDAHLRNLRRSGTEAVLTGPGRTDVMAEGRVTLTGFRDEFEGGAWKITRVQHDISTRGFTTTIGVTAQKEILPQAEGGGPPPEEENDE